MKVVFLSLGFPYGGKQDFLYSSLIHQFALNGHDILVVAPALEKNKVGLINEDNLKVLRVKTRKLLNVGILQKGVANIMLPYQYKKALKKYRAITTIDLIITPTPPITLYSLVAWLKKKSNAKVYLILRDIFPQNAVDLGILNKNSPIYSYFRRKEQKLYAISNSIGCMSDGNISYIKKHNPKIDPRKLHILPNWGNMDELHDEVENNRLRKSEGLENKFIVIFGGNLGMPQKLENIVALAESCLDIKDILFLIVGNGSMRLPLENLLAAKKLQNVKLRNHLAPKEYFRLLQVAHVGLISLNEKFTIPNIPSKSLAYYNAKKPILASLDLNTDFGKILETYNTGLWAPAGNTIELKQKLLILYNNKSLRDEMGENGYNYMKNELSTEKIYNILMNRITEV